MLDFWNEWRRLSVLMDQYDFDDSHWSIVLSSEVLNSVFTSRIGGALPAVNEGWTDIALRGKRCTVGDQKAEAAKSRLSSGMVQVNFTIVVYEISIVVVWTENKKDLQQYSNSLLVIKPTNNTRRAARKSSAQWKVEYDTSSSMIISVVILPPPSLYFNYIKK
jgi:hypothetical protein